MTKGMLITFEGGDGAGKSTLIEGVRRYLSQKGASTLVTREPGGTPLGELIRQWLLNGSPEVQISSKAELLLFLASRAQHIHEVIIPAIKKGSVVLCDRFNDSSIAYQGAGRDLGMEIIENLCDLACGEVVPDLTFYLDIDPVVGLGRRHQADGEGDRIEKEKLAFHQKVRAGFLELARRHPRIQVIDAGQSADKVLEQALEKIRTETETETGQDEQMNL